jgi:hypothetical protein
VRKNRSPQTPARTEGNKQARVFRVTQEAAGRPMAPGTQAQHDTKVELAGKLGMPTERMDDNMRELQSRKDSPATTGLTTEGTGDRGGTTYTIHGHVEHGPGVNGETSVLTKPADSGGTYKTEHKIADNYLIPDALERFETDNPQIGPLLPTDSAGNRRHLADLSAEEVTGLNLTPEQRATWHDILEAAGAHARWRQEGYSGPVSVARTMDLPGAQFRRDVRDTIDTGGGLGNQQTGEPSRQEVSASWDAAARQNTEADNAQRLAKVAQIPVRDDQRYTWADESDHAATLNRPTYEQGVRWSHWPLADPSAIPELDPVDRPDRDQPKGAEPGRTGEAGTAEPGPAEGLAGTDLPVDAADAQMMDRQNPPLPDPPAPTADVDPDDDPDRYESTSDRLG